LEEKRLWRQQIKEHWVAILVVVIILVEVVALIILGYRFDWTGFNGSTRSDKTLWDWMQLLFIPVVLAIAGFWFNHRERKEAELLNENERKAADLRSTTEKEIEQKRAKAEQEIALDNQREPALQVYLDRISELLLQTNLSEERPDEKVFMLIKARTLTTLKGLDPDRKTSLFGFLWEAGLIGRFNLNHADFSGADWSGANLRGVKLRYANLSRANLYGVTLDDAELLHTNLKGANLVRIMMCNVDLRGADLTDADLTDAYLIKVNLEGAIYCQEQLNAAKSLNGVTMCDGSIHS
jgi:hypothetical protein